jgi:GTPase Era involved in 16S rRNA processing
MPSVKSYQNRKHEIEVLKHQLATSEGYYQNLLKASNQAADGFRQNMNAAQEEFEERTEEFESIIQSKNIDIMRLNKVTQVLKCQRDLDHIALQKVQETDSKIIDGLSNKVRELERKVKIYRDYIRYGFAVYPETCMVTVEPPACLKPLDALKWFEQINAAL